MIFAKFWRRGLVGAVTVALAGFVFISGMAQTSGQNGGGKEEQADTRPGGEEFPPFPKPKYPVDTPEATRDTYTFAALHPEVVKYVPCYCLCSKTMGHKSLADCFISSYGTSKSPVVWSKHASECVVCTSVGKEARRLFLAGLSVRDIQIEIDRQYRSKFPNRTDTLEPPAELHQQHN